MSEKEPIEWRQETDWFGILMWVSQGWDGDERIREMVEKPDGSFWMSEFWEKLEEMADQELSKRARLFKRALVTRIKRAFIKSGIFFDSNLVEGYKKSCDDQHFFGEYDAYVRPEMVEVFLGHFWKLCEYGIGEWSGYGARSHEFVGQVVRSLIGAE